MILQEFLVVSLELMSLHWPGRPAGFRMEKLDYTKMSETFRTSHMEGILPMTLTLTVPVAVPRLFSREIVYSPLSARVHLSSSR